MTMLELVADVLGRDLEMTRMHLADLTDAEMLVRPVPGANHAAWQLGHLAVAEAGMINSVKGGAGTVLPAGFAEKFTKETAKLDDAKAFPGKAEILDAFAKARAATIAWTKTVTEADLNTPAPERMRSFVPTVGHLMLLMPQHTMMHVGQIQVLRRKLGKPVMF